MTQLFTERVPFKPFEYPIYYTEGWLKQAEFWLHTEIPVKGDLKDWNENLNKSEKHLVGNILLGFDFKRNVKYLIIGQLWLLSGFQNMKLNKWKHDVWFTRNHSHIFTHI